jgi:hypothetical protein
MITFIALKSSVFWDIMPCSPLKVNQRFRGICSLHLQGQRISQVIYQHERRWQADPNLACPFFCLCHCYISFICHLAWFKCSFPLPSSEIQTWRSGAEANLTQFIKSVFYCQQDLTKFPLYSALYSVQCVWNHRQCWSVDTVVTKYAQYIHHTHLQTHKCSFQSKRAASTVCGVISLHVVIMCSWRWYCANFIAFGIRNNTSTDLICFNWKIGVLEVLIYLMLHAIKLSYNEIKYCMIMQIPHLWDIDYSSGSQTVGRDP